MRDRILSTAHGRFVMQEFDGRNNSGIVPIGDKVLLLVDPAQTKTSGGVLITDVQAETQTMGSTTGLIYAAGDQAFMYDAERVVGWIGRKPAVGDRVFFQKYAGEIYTGTDGRVYRLVQDRSIAGIGIDQAASAMRNAAAE